ncbi:MAG: YjfB family protein [Treponema sp.]|jgi:hypothetical protein|nr:YjfB family protein [Treponema sp.]
MDIQSLSVAMAQTRVMEEAGAAVQRMSLSNTEAQGEAVTQLINSAAPTPKNPDPALGNYINISG